jgi:hypothetical protein
MSLRGTLGIAGVALAIAFPGIQAARLVEPEGRFDGEYGLFIRHVEQDLHVGWLTDEPDRGVLRAYVDGELATAEKTPAAQIHAAVVKLNGDQSDGGHRDGESVLLEYGGSEDSEPLHRTRVQLEPPPSEATLVYEGVDSLYVIGDSHGEFDTVAGLLQNAGLIDAELHWTGGTRHLVMLGDLFDRGADVTRLLWFVYGLEREAEAAGGRVHTVLGNHEIMVMIGDPRYVSDKEDSIAKLHNVGYSELFEPHTSVLGRWLASKPALLRIEDVLLAHGGVGPRYLGYGLSELNDTLRLYMGEELFTHWYDDEFLGAWAEETTLDSAAVDRRWTFFNHSESIFWYRDLVYSDTLGEYLTKVLERFRSSVHVVGHTPLDHIEERYDGRLIGVDMEEAATELLFLAKNEEGGWDRWKIGLEGPPGPILKDSVPGHPQDSTRRPR